MIADPLQLRGKTARNRLVLTAVTTNLAAADGRVTDDLVGFYDARARDLGVAIVEAAAVRADGRIVAGSVGAWDEAHVPGLDRLARTVKQHGALAVLQLNHAGARALPVGTGELLGASPSDLRLRQDLAPRALGVDELRRLADDFGAAAFRAVRAGFDGVELHGAHFYLLSQFLSPLVNLRRDRYGGDLAGRIAFPREVVRMVRARIGPEPLVLFRVNGIERIEGGLTPEDAARAATELVRAGVDVVDVSLGARVAWREEDGVRFLESSSTLFKDEARGATLPIAAAIRRATAAPVIAVGKLGDAGIAEEALRTGAADLVGIGRQLIADPETAGKLLRDGGAGIDVCSECVACLRSIRKGPIKCAVNRDVTGKAVRAGGAA